MSKKQHYSQSRAEYNQKPTESLSKICFGAKKSQPAPVAAAEEGYESDSTLYNEPWDSNFPLQIPIRTPTDAEMKAAGKNPFLLSPRRTAGSSSTPPRFEFSPGQSRRPEEPFPPPPEEQAPPPPRRPLPEKFEGFLPILAKQYPHLVPKPNQEPDDLYEVPVSRPRGSPEMLQATNPFAKPGPRDPYVGCSVVVGLTADTFKTFIRDVDAAFVLFYDPGDNDGSWAKSGVKKAALVTRRPNHVFAAVDCTKETRLCQSQYVESYPTMKLYARGAAVNTYADTFLSGDQMKVLVERAPVAAPAASPKKKDCSIQ